MAASVDISAVRNKIKPMTDLNAWLLEGWRQRQREAGNQPVTINRAVQRLHALLARAVEWKALEKHPFSGLKPLRHDKSGRVRYLTADEETQLREALLRYAHMSPDRLAMAVERVVRTAEPAPNASISPPGFGAGGVSSAAL